MMHKNFVAPDAMPGETMQFSTRYQRFGGLCMLFFLACTPARPRRSSYASPGSCQMVCKTYAYCNEKRPTSTQRTPQACQQECQHIFGHQGVEDGETLRELEDLSCPKLLRFIEGPTDNSKTKQSSDIEL